MSHSISFNTFLKPQLFEISLVVDENMPKDKAACFDKDDNLLFILDLSGKYQYTEMPLAMLVRKTVVHPSVRNLIKETTYVKNHQRPTDG